MVFVIWNYFRGGNAVKKCTHRAFRIRTYIGLGPINCVLISLAFILLSILFKGYSAVGLDGDIF